MKSVNPMVGERHGRLAITEVVGRRATGKTSVLRWIVNCRCDCGHEVDAVVYANLRSGNTQSCGCLKRERTRQANIRHGATTAEASAVDHALWKVWKSMHQRCREKHPHYTNIRVCVGWKRFAPFRDWALANGYQQGLTIDRVDYEKGYSPSNCRWATYAEQARNRSSNRLVEFEDKILCIADWADDPRCVVSQQVLGERLRRGWEMPRAMTSPLRLAATYSYEGETKRIYDWAQDPRCQVRLETLKVRLSRGWSIGEALTPPASY